MKLRNVCKVEDTLYVAPQVVGLPEIGSIVAVDDSLLGAVKKVKHYCDMVSGYSIELNLERVAEALKVIQDAKAQGIPFSEEPLPTVAQIAHAISK